jgi:hypothetical protein
MILAWISSVDVTDNVPRMPFGYPKRMLMSTTHFFPPSVSLILSEVPANAQRRYQRFNLILNDVLVFVRKYLVTNRNSFQKSFDLNWKTGSNVEILAIENIANIGLDDSDSRKSICSAVRSRLVPIVNSIKVGL